MRTFVVILLVALMLATLGVLFAGIITMGRSEGDPMRSNRLMRYRVLLQAGALVLFIILMSMLRS